MSGKKLYVDDVRPAPAGWVLARTVDEAVDALEKETFEEVSLDFVIGYHMDSNFLPVAHHIAEMPAGRRPARVLIHTSSAQGARLLQRALEGHVKEIVRV